MYVLGLKTYIIYKLIKEEDPLESSRVRIKSQQRSQEEKKSPSNRIEREREGERPSCRVAKCMCIGAENTRKQLLMR